MQSLSTCSNFFTFEVCSSKVLRLVSLRNRCYVINVTIVVNKKRRAGEKQIEKREFSDYIRGSLKTQC